MTVRIQTSEGYVKVMRHVGLLQVEVPQSETAVVGDLHGLGFVATPMGWTAGYTRQRWAAIGPQCRAILWVDGSSAVDEETRQTLLRVAGVCIVDGSPSEAGDGQARVNQEIKP